MAYARILPSILKAKSCENKTPFETRSAAKRALKEMANERSNGHVGDMKCYHCEFCGKFHFGHNPQIMQQFEIPT